MPPRLDFPPLTLSSTILNKDLHFYMSLSSHMV